MINKASQVRRYWKPLKGEHDCGFGQNLSYDVCAKWMQLTSLIGFDVGHNRCNCTGLRVPDVLWVLSRPKGVTRHVTIFSESHRILFWAFTLWFDSFGWFRWPYCSTEVDCICVYVCVSTWSHIHSIMVHSTRGSIVPQNLFYSLVLRVRVAPGKISCRWRQIIW